MVVFLVTLNLCYGSMMWVEIEEDDGQGKWLRWITIDHDLEIFGC